MDTIKFAKDKKCNLIIVHHGLFWDSISSVTGRNYYIIKELIENKIALYASHAPLDVHKKIGNSAQIAKILGLKKLSPFGFHKGIYWGFSSSFHKPITKDEFFRKLQPISKRPFYHITRSIKNIGIVSGSGSFAITEAYNKNIDTLLTGETSHSNLIMAKDLGINIIFAGHYNTETLGVRALGKLIEKKFALSTIFYENNTNL